MKIGISSSSTSLMPRRLATVSAAIIATSAGTFHGCQSSGSRLNRASTPLATERAAVRTKFTISAEPETRPA